jgi:hypothetical protein
MEAISDIMRRPYYMLDEVALASFNTSGFTCRAIVSNSDINLRTEMFHKKHLAFSNVDNGFRSKVDVPTMIYSSNMKSKCFFMDTP